MKKVILSAFACNPYLGSEAGYGWNWAIGLVNEGFEVHCLTSKKNKIDIAQYPKVDHLHFHYISLSFGLERLYLLSQATMYLYYILWQWMAYRKAKHLSRIYSFELAHHVTWGSIQQGSFLYKLKIPLIFGPAGGGQKAPEKFKAYFLDHWSSEVKRERVSNLLIRFNPACKKMLRKARTVLVSNKDTHQLAKKAGAKNVYSTLDTALPERFFQQGLISHQPIAGQIKLLWVGRFLPRKGLLLVLDVMNALKAHPGITLTIVGDGEMREAAKERYNEFQLQNTVSFTGLVPYEEVSKYYATHDAFFFTSLRESGGVQLVEAMAYSLPVITLDLHGSSEIITEQTGIKISVEEPLQVITDLAKAILYIANDPVRYQSMSSAAYRFACEQTWDKKIKDIVAHYY